VQGVVLSVNYYPDIVNDLLKMAVIIKHDGELWAVSANLLFKFIVYDRPCEGVEILIRDEILNAQYCILSEIIEIFLQYSIL